MPNLKITREQVIRAAAEAVRKGGTAGLNARSVAGELGCSTQPVYSQFKGMEELKRALKEEAVRLYRKKIEAYISESGRSRYEAFGMGFVKFAREEKGLFRFLYFSERTEAGPPRVEDPFLEDIIGEMKTAYGMDEARAREFHRDMGVFSFGLAVLANAGAESTDKEVEESLRREFYALYALYFPERPPLKGKGE